MQAESEMWNAAPELVSSSADIQGKLRDQVENWRKRLLDLGNRNSLISCSFNPSRGVIEIVHPNCEEVWRKLAADSEAGTDPMRFPWRRDLVPPPLEVDGSGGVQGKRAAGVQQRIPGTAEVPVAMKVAESLNDQPLENAEPNERTEWNPPLAECLASRRLRETDLMTGIGDKAINRRLRTLEGSANLSMSEQGVHCLFVAFGFLKWFESADSDIELRSPLMLIPVPLSRASADAPWELIETRELKRRRHGYKLMQEPRVILRQQLKNT